MQKNQKQLLTVYLPITMLFILLDNLCPEVPWVNYLKFVSIISLFLVALRTVKHHAEQKILTAALFFVAVGDFFLVFCKTFFDSSERTLPFGILGFTIAYLLLIAAFRKGGKIGWPRAAAAVPILALAVPAVLRLFPHIEGILKYGLTIFIIILCFTSWTCLCTIWEGYYSRQSSGRIALAGILMLICDLGVGLSLFDPNFSGEFVNWLKNIIWGSYVPAWTLIVMTVQEKNLINQRT